MRRLTALTRGREDAQRVVDALVNLGVALDDVSVLVVSPQVIREAQVQHTTAVPQATAVGTTVGSALGLGLVAIGWLPGVLAAGPVVAVLQGLAGGAAAGSLVGALAGLGWWKAEAEIPDDLLEADGILVGVPISERRADEALRAARSAGALRLYLT